MRLRNPACSAAQAFDVDRRRKLLTANHMSRPKCETDQQRRPVSPCEWPHEELNAFRHLP